MWPASGTTYGWIVAGWGLDHAGHAGGLPADCRHRPLRFALGRLARSVRERPRIRVAVHPLEAYVRAGASVYATAGELPLPGPRSLEAVPPIPCR
jgi:hypothetical protein